ncbi:phage tail sheath subtilisin-like domain-containing protein [Halogeometricum sp. S1BR25-6]|uniref:Phage tail sheath subtilisin-like domain-containing protein n=1 Tax=Halogeometricum salsisoli TaxID=2950536 RepID=A0ABU2GJZ5_9EURY|nr:choice-of-anchor D domain-containing protein [Halogeometricum sp. S1BR25-6]MDS0301132.1 phage tail sheath subtilisin-like domain-containing protein [Halogeometricum sp. S1BR25-6]
MPGMLGGSARLGLGLVAVGETATKTLSVRNIGRTDLVVSADDLTVSGGADTEDEEFVVTSESDGETTLAPGDSVELTVTFEPESAGEKNATLEVDAGETPLEVRLEGSARDGVLNASPWRVDFGSVSGGETATAALTLTNTGEEAVTVAEEDVEVVAGGDTGTDEFAAAVDLGEEGTTTLAPGDALDLSVRFAPNDDEPKRATVVTSAADGLVAVRVVGNLADEEERSSGPTSTESDAPVLEATAVGPGPWGNNVALVVSDALGAQPGSDDAPFRLTVRYWSDADAEAAFDHGANPEHDAVPDPSVEEVFDGLSVNEADGNYYEKVVNGTSNLVTVRRLGEGRPATGAPGSPAVSRLDGGSGGSAQLSDYAGRTTAGERTGLAAFEEVDDIAIVCAPDEVTVANLTNELVDHCERMGDRFAVLQAPERADRPSKLRPPVDSGNAAFYYPWIRVADPATNAEKLVPPGGHITGVYARTDAERGVHKAPANEVVRGAIGLQKNVSKGDQDVLNPKGVNCIRSFPGRGVRVWGARTTSSDAADRYVNVRRLMLYIEESLDEGTQHVVFEPNDEPLWARVRQSISGFLTTTWRDGALQGATPEEAFFVKCDRTTMTQDDIDNGRLKILVGVAPVKPAEFVIIRIAQWTGDAAN